MVRVYKGGKDIESADETYFDQTLYLTVTKEAQRGSKIVRQALGKIEQTVSDLFLLDRLKVMVSNGQINCTSDNPTDLRKAEFKKGGGEVESAEEATE